MKKWIMAIVCLMTMVMSANAQRYYRGVGYSRSVAASRSFANYMYWNSRLSRYRNNGGSFEISKHEKTIIAGFGIGKSYCDENFENSTDIDLTIYNVFLSMKVGQNKNENEYSVPVSAQVGYMINLLNFGGKDFVGRKHNTKLYISPLVGIGYSEFGGALMVKHQFLYVIGKATNKGLGFSVGLSY